MNTTQQMSAIFKTHIIPNLKRDALDASETKAIHQVLELLEATDTDAYKNIQSNSDFSGITANFTTQVAQHIYFHPKRYTDTTEGIAFVTAWLPLLKEGYYPDEKSTNKLVEFLTFNLGYFQSEAFSEATEQQLLQVIKILVESTSEAALPIAQFLILRIFDIRDVLSSEYLIQNCLKHDLLSGTYAVKQDDETISTFPFTIDSNFINCFFEGNWELFIHKFHQLLPVGRMYEKSAYDIMISWFSSDLAAFYEANPNSALTAIEALKERLIWADAQSDALLHLTTAEGNYPLMQALANKKWDSGDVLLFNVRDTSLPKPEQDAGYINFLDWLIADSGANLNSEAFKDYGIKILSENTANNLPIECIPFWFQIAHPQTGFKNHSETFNTLFSKLFLEDDSFGLLPTMRLKGEDVQVTGPFVIRTIAQSHSDVMLWLDPLKKEGLKNPLNQFLIRAFCDAGEALLELFPAEEQEKLQRFLLTLAYSSRDASAVVRAKNIPLIAEALGFLCVEAGNFTRVNEIWALKDLDVNAVEVCNQFARKHYINENRPLTLNIIQAWFNYLGDYYYSVTKEAVWVPEALTTQGERVAQYFNLQNEDVGFFLDRLVNRILSFHKRCKSKEATNPIFKAISADIEVFLVDFLGKLKNEKLHLNTITHLYEYSNSDDSRFSSNDTLYDQIESYSQFVLETEEAELEEATEQDAEETQESESAEEFVNTVPSSTIDINAIEVNHHYVETLLTNLETYKTAGCETELLDFFNTRIADLKTWLSNDDTGLEMRFGQTLYMTLLDTDLAPGTPLETYGNLSKNIFVHLVKGSNLANSYAMGLKAISKSGAYSDPLANALLQVADQLNA
ncbi:hypothetical protein [Winogradskyella sp. SM1960]|uniref:hypothetical protein n=1 Tax=Winogradskyella sp. SM1960 TaxID=2865955 RepID=UPI001CD54C2A|nr:hypothetical protein [Winogradskyella sp. SM1960]